MSKAKPASLFAKKSAKAKKLKLHSIRHHILHLNKKLNKSGKMTHKKIKIGLTKLKLLERLRLRKTASKARLFKKKNHVVLKKRYFKSVNKISRKITKKPEIADESTLIITPETVITQKPSGIPQNAVKTNKLSLLVQSWISPWKYHRKILTVTAVSVSTIVIAFYFLVFKDLPNPKLLTYTQSPQSTIIRDRNGEILYRIYKDANRTRLAWEEIPPVVKKATLAIEDANFANHLGVEPKAILRAFLNNMGENNSLLYQGGSTITQQLVKNRLLSSEKTYQRKIREVVLAVWTELLFSKKEILTMYLNEVGYGGPAYGIEAASELYFNKPARDLTLPEAAFLAGLPAAPTTFSPYGPNPQLAYSRQHQVLDRMLKLKMINKEQYDDALSKKLALAQQKIDIKAPHFVMYTKGLLADKFGDGLITEAGLDVTTSLDLSIQTKAEEIVKKNIAEIGNKFNIHNSAVLVTNPSTGEILAMVGSVDYFDTNNKGYVNATTASRQPGSSIKPINYSYAFDHGWTPNSVLNDQPVVYTAKGSKEVYAPKNYDGKFHGIVTLRSALANSYNVPAVMLLNSYGVKNMIDQGIAMGIKSWFIKPVTAGLSLTLGGSEVTMMDMARAYGTLANMGVRKELRTIKNITDNNKNDITDLFYKDNTDTSNGINVYAEDNKRVTSELAAYWVTDILSDNVARLPAFGPYARLTIPGHKVAVKTGTTNDYRDNWTIGYTPDYLVAVWVGNNDGSYMNKNLVSGITGAAPIWNDVMSSILTDKPDKEFQKPSGLIPVKICAVNGLLTCPNCPQEKTEYFTADKIPTKKCFFKPQSECDEIKKQLDGKSDDEKKAMLNGCI